ncbi:MAG: hypothetical protein SPI53_00195 [Erysipelotrichaceae bacterium]|nr:hypothetical protein [Erysipelotrichaceae bacterium]
MNRKNKNIILFIVATILMIMVFLFGYYFNNANKNLKINTRILKYTYYKINEPDIKFVVADIEFDSNQKFEIKLDDMLTDEGIRLNDYGELIKKLNDNKYELSVDFEKNVITKLDDQIITKKILIPINKHRDKVVVKYLNSFFEIKLNEFNNGDDLKKNESKPKIVVPKVEDKEYEITAIEDFTGDILVNNGHTYSGSSSSRMYAVSLKINKFKGNIINKAIFVAENGKTYNALAGSYQSERYTNIIGKEITDHFSGSIFFELRNPAGKNIRYSGSLIIELDSNEKIIISDVVVNEGDGQ